MEDESPPIPTLREKMSYIVIILDKNGQIWLHVQSFEIVSNRLGLYQLFCHHVKGKRVACGLYIYNGLSLSTAIVFAQIRVQPCPLLYGIKRILVSGLMNTILK